MRTSRSAALATGGLLAAVVLAGCGGGGGSSSGPFATSSHGPDPTVASPSASASDGADGVKVIGTVASDLLAPWGIAFLPDDSALVTERDTAKVLHVVGDGESGEAKVSTVGTVAAATQAGEGGLLGIAVSPTYAQDRTVFLYVTAQDDNRILKATFDGTSLSDPTPILTGIPRGNIHDGGRLVFGPDGYLYASTGETGDSGLAQDPSSLGGKILRMTKAGKPAPGNPDPSSVVWTIGHRNVQGLAFDPQKHLWASEFGQNTFDELNLVQKGTNYGWPEVEGKGDQDRYRNPQVVWDTSLASPSGLAYLDGHLWLGALAGGRLWRIDVDGTKASDPKGFFVGEYGRVRTVIAAPDGNLWMTTSNRDGRGTPEANDDRILLVSPGS